MEAEHRHEYAAVIESNASKRCWLQVINQCREYDSMIHDYETMTTDLLEWIQKTNATLNDREFANSLAGVQQQLATFNGYRTVEKPPKYVFATLSVSSQNGVEMKRAYKRLSTACLNIRRYRH